MSEYGVSKAYADKLLQKYISQVEKKKSIIERNFSEMDIENADIQNEFENIKNDMISNCNKLIGELQNYKFY